jgi:hypothetical protein
MRASIGLKRMPVNQSDFKNRINQSKHAKQTREIETQFKPQGKMPMVE